MPPVHTLVPFVAEVERPAPEKAGGSPSEPKPDPAASGCGPPAGSETILLVEDDVNLRTVVARMLERVGFTVLTASNGRQALTIWDAHAAAIDLLITDVVMPELGGPELVEQLEERGVTLPVLYMSGYSDQVMLGRLPPAASAPILRKPFTLDILLKAVRQILDDRSSPQ